MSSLSASVLFCVCISVSTPWPTWVGSSNLFRPMGSSWVLWRLKLSRPLAGSWWRFEKACEINLCFGTTWWSNEFSDLNRLGKPTNWNFYISTNLSEIKRDILPTYRATNRLQVWMDAPVQAHVETKSPPRKKIILFQIMNGTVGFELKSHSATVVKLRLHLHHQEYTFQLRWHLTYATNPNSNCVSIITYTRKSRRDFSQNALHCSSYDWPKRNATRRMVAKTEKSPIRNALDLSVLLCWLET